MSDKSYIAEEQPDGTFIVKKFEDGEEGSEQYVINKIGGCNCPGYKYRRSCRHVRFMALFSGEETATVAKAKEAVRTVVDALGPLLASHGEIEFDKDSHGRVKKVSFNAEASEELDEPRRLSAVVQGVVVEVSLT